MFKKLYYSTTVVCILSLCVKSTLGQTYGQYENVWAFGDSAGLDFNNMVNSLPTPIHTNMLAESGVSICDKNGQLLFYTNGSCVWNRNHEIMPHGASFINVPTNTNTPLREVIGASHSAAMGGVIIPIPGQVNRYYIFSVTSQTGGGMMVDLGDAGKLFYSIVDMNLDNGLGDIDTNFVSIPVDSGLQEHVIAIPGNNCDYWVVSTTMNPVIPHHASFKTYHVTENGVNTNPVTSLSLAPPMQSISNYWLSQEIKSSFDHNKIAISYSKWEAGDINIGNHGAGFRLFDFDRNTGIVSNELLIEESKDSLCNSLSFCFSPDNTKLYLSVMNRNRDTSKILQYDLSSNNATVIKNSKVVIANGLTRENNLPSRRNGMKVGPDGKIYVFHSEGEYFDDNYPYMSVIPNPNITGTGCGFSKDVIQLPQGSGPVCWMSNNIAVHEPDTITSSQAITGACATIEENGSTILTPNDPTASFYLWDNGTTTLDRTVEEDGIYWVSYIKDCTYHVDSFRVSFSQVTIHTEPGCINEAKGKAWVEKVDPSDTVNYQFTWLNANMDTLINASNLDGVPPGIYYVYVYTDFCEGLFPVEIKAVPDSMQFQNIDPVDTLIPYGSSVQITTQSDAVRWVWEPVTYLDNPQSENPVSTPKQSIIYQVIGYGPLGCSDTGQVKIRVDYSSNIKVPSAFSPNGDGLNDVFKVYLQQYEKLVTFKVFNRWGNLVFETSDINRGWDGSHKGQPATADVYMYYIEVLLPGPDGGKVKTIKGDVILVR